MDINTDISTLLCTVISIYVYECIYDNWYDPLINIYLADKIAKAIEISAVAFAEGEYKRRKAIESTGDRQFDRFKDKRIRSNIYRDSY